MAPSRKLFRNGQGQVLLFFSIYIFPTRSNLHPLRNKPSIIHVNIITHHLLFVHSGVSPAQHICMQVSRQPSTYACRCLASPAHMQAGVSPAQHMCMCMQVSRQPSTYACRRLTSPAHMQAGVSPAQHICMQVSRQPRTYACRCLASPSSTYACRP